MAKDEITLSKEDAETIHDVLGKSWNAIRKLNPSLAKRIRDAQALIMEPESGEQAAQQTEPDVAPAEPVLGMPATNEAGAAITEEPNSKEWEPEMVDAAEQLDLNDEPAETMEEPEGENVETQDESDEPEGSDDESKEEDTEETASQ